MTEEEISVRRFRSMAAGLWEIRQFIRNPRFLRTGSPIPNFGGLRPREIVGNWLVCAALNYDSGSEQYSLTTDTTGGDGFIRDSSDGGIYPTEHVIVYSPASSPSDTHRKIISAFESKRAKGDKYLGKILVIFLDENGPKWYPNRIVGAVSNPYPFADVWVVALQKVLPDSYTYAVTRLRLNNGSAPVWKVRIKRPFRRWRVTRTQ